MEDDIDDVEEGEVMKEDEDDNDEEEEDEADKPSAAKPKKRRKPRSVLTGRGVTLGMLLEDGVMEPGEKCLSIDYLGQKFVADLQPDGRIRWPEANQVFNSPSAWAIYCKRLVNPSKKSGCGWASVKYKGKKLDQFKTTWFRKQNPSASSSQVPPPVSQKELPPSTSQSTPLSSHKSPPNKPSTSHGDVQNVSSSSSSALSTSFHSPRPSTSQATAAPKSAEYKASVSGTTASYWPTETKRPSKAPHSTSSGRGRKPNIGYIHPPPAPPPQQKSPSLVSPTSSSPSSASRPSGALRSPVGKRIINN